MRGVNEIIQVALSLPVEERALVVDSLQKTFNRPSAELDSEWVDLARLRLEEIHSGKTKPVNGEEVFSKIRSRFNK